MSGAFDNTSLDDKLVYVRGSIKKFDIRFTLDHMLLEQERYEVQERVRTALLLWVDTITAIEDSNDKCVALDSFLESTVVPGTNTDMVPSVKLLNVIRLAYEQEAIEKK